MTRTLTTLICLTALLCGAPAEASPSKWAQGELADLLTRNEGQVSRQSGWLGDKGLFSAEVRGRVSTGKITLCAGRLRSTGAASDVYRQTQRQDRQDGARIRDLPRGTGYRFLRSLSKSQVRVSVTVLEGDHLFRVELTLPKSASNKSKHLKAWLGMVKASVRMNDLPEASGAKRIKSKHHLWQLRNDTGGGIKVTVRVETRSGPKTYSWRLKSGETRTLQITPGRNFVTATSDRENVNPFVGWEQHSRGQMQSTVFYLETRR
jgi:hypothetical protein